YIIYINRLYMLFHYRTYEFIVVEEKMTKYKNRSQEIGELGETIYRLYSQRTLKLTPNKLESDYGIDFSCQIGGNPIGSVRPMLPEFLLVNVKSSELQKPYARLEKSDMEFTLKSAQPLVFILVDVNKEDVYHRFFDKELLVEFHQRLITNKKTFRLDPSKMSKDPDHFIEQLSIVKKRSYQNKLGLLKARLGLQKLIGEVKLEIHQTEDGSVAIVEANEAEDLFDKTHKLFPIVRESFLAQDINKLSLPLGAFKNVSEQLNDIADLTSLIAPLHYDMRRLQLKRNGKKIATCIFEIRGFGDEKSYYHPSGMSLTLSRKRKGQDNQYYHFTEVIFTAKDTDNLFEYPELINLLRVIQEGDTIDGIPVETWPELLRIAGIVRYLPEIYDSLSLEPHVQLNELNNMYTVLTYMFIKSLLLDQKDSFIGFILGSEDTSDLKLMQSKIKCPFLISLPEGQYIATIQFDSELFYDEKNPDRILGIKSTRNPVIKSCLPVENTSLVEPALLVTEDIALAYFMNKQPGTIQNPFSFGIEFNNEEDLSK
ncbi:hypothetical protein, partial [Paenibacillus glucanolyticus]